MRSAPPATTRPTYPDEPESAGGMLGVENCGNPKLGRSDLARGSILPSVQFDCRHTFEIRPTAWKAAEGRAWDTDGTILSAMQLSRLVREAEVGRVGERPVRRCVANLTDRCPADPAATCAGWRNRLANRLRPPCK